MSDGTKIEWTHRPGTIPSTMNALVGCQKVSQGCAHCYAIEVAHVRAGNPLPIMQEKFGGTTRAEGGKRIWTGKVTVTEDALLAPLRAKKPRTYFVNSMSDLFYEGVSDEVIDRHFAVFALCPQHTFIVLTKRPERMLACFGDDFSGRDVQIGVAAGNMLDGDWIWNEGKPFRRRIEKLISLSMGFGEDGECQAEDYLLPLKNVWLGVSVEDQATADARIPLLLQTPAAVRFISYEPALGPVDLRWNHDAKAVGFKQYMPAPGPVGQWPSDERYIDWVICGGESGNGARPLHPDWARLVRDQCVAAGVPFFFKQWGEWVPGAQGADYRRADRVAFDRINLAGKSVRSLSSEHSSSDGMMYRVGKKAAGNLLDGKVWQQFPR